MVWKIAIVDDDEHVVKGIGATLNQSNLNCTVVGTARNGKDGLDMILKEQPDLVITDIYMPERDGIEMIQALRDNGFDKKIIILSGYSEFQHAKQALKLKIEDYLSKPASRQTIIHTVKQTLEQLDQTLKKNYDFQRYKTKVNQYERYLTVELIELAVKGQLNLTTLQSNQQAIIEQWSSRLHMPIKLNFMTIERDQTSKLADNYLMSFAIANIINDTMTHFSFDFHYIKVDQHNSILCLHLSEKEAEETYLLEKIDTAINLLKKNLLNVIALNTHVERGNIKSTWTETISAIHQLLMTNTTDDGHMLAVNLTSINTQLAKAIRTTDIERIKASINDFFNELNDKTFLPSIAIHIGLELWTIFKYELADIGINIAEQSQPPFNIYNKLIQYNTWAELNGFFNDFIDDISKESVFQDNMKHSKLIDDVLHYIEDNIEKPITLNEIAEELYISRNYLGKLFKNLMNLPFKAYVTQYRIDKARKMLLTGHYRIYEVAEAVGFDNPAYFSAVFKKVLGYPPSHLIHEEVNEELQR